MGNTTSRKAASSASGLAGDVAGLSRAWAKGNRKIQKGYREQGDVAAGELMRPTVEGGLSPAIERQLEAEKRGIGKAYGDVASVGIRGLAARGMGGAPTGATASLLNTAGRGMGESETAAMDKAYERQLPMGLKALDYYTGQQETYDPTRLLGTSLQGAQTQAGAAQARAGMGSGWGDIGGALRGAAGLVLGGPMGAPGIISAGGLRGIARGVMGK